MATKGQPQKNGLAIIITNDYSGTDKPVLKGPHKDGEKMADLFMRLNYEICFWKNLSMIQLQHYLQQLVSTINYSMYSNCIVVVFSGHGTTDDKTKLTCIFTHEPRCALYPVQELVDCFMPKNAPEIATIPKVFLIDACLGDRCAIDEAVTVPISKGVASVPAVMSKSGHSIRTITVPSESNYILAYATSVGFRAFEVEACGGLWMDALWKKIREKAHCDTVSNILSDVNEDLSRMYQDSSFQRAMTQPQSINKSQGRIYFVPQGPQLAQDTEQGFTRGLNGPPQLERELSSTGQPNSCKTRLNNMWQARKITEPSVQVTTANGKFEATVTFQYSLNNETIYCRSEPKDLKREAIEDAAKNACMRLNILERSTSKSAQHRQSSSPQQPTPIRKQPSPVRNQPPPRRQVSSSSDTTPVQILKMGCESAKPRYTYDLQECSTGVPLLFQFKVIVRDSTGKVVCQETGSKREKKKEAKHDAASKANAELGF